MPFAPILRSTAAPAPVIEDGVPLTSVGMTFDEMQTELLAQLGGRQDIAASRLALWINAAYRDVTTSLSLSECQGSYGFNTVVDQPYYVLPAAVFSTAWMALADAADFQRVGGIPMRKRSIDWYRRQIDTQNTTLSIVPNVPTDYFEYKGVLVLWPTPVSVLPIAVDFQIRPDKLVATTDSPMLPEEWHWAIILRARVIAHEALMEWEFAGPAQNSYVNYIRQRLDLKAEEDTGRLVLSSVPRTSRQLTRSHVRNPLNLDIID